MKVVLNAQFAGTAENANKTIYLLFQQPSRAQDCHSSKLLA
jgi:hypothetical protein